MLKLSTKYILVDPLVCSGIPVIAGTRLPVARLLAELADQPQFSPLEFAGDYDIDLKVVVGVLQDIAVMFSFAQEN